MSIKSIFYKQREKFEKEAAKRDLEFNFPDNILEYKDISYSNDGLKEHRLDIFRPKDMENVILPVIVNIHGGGLIMGNKEFNRFFCARLSSMGFLVFSVEYRLVPDCMIYEQLSDITMAMNFISDNISLYNGDTEHIYAVGDSGGACLLTYHTAVDNCENVANAANVEPSHLKINALGLISGMFYTTRFDQIGLFLPKYVFGKNYKKGNFAKYVNPEHKDIVTSLPPCFLVTSTNDNLSHYTLDYEKVLTKYNVPHKLLNFSKDSKLTHAFSVFYPFLDESTATIEKMVNFLRKYW